METSGENWSIDRLKNRLERVEGEVAQLRESHNKLQQLLVWCAFLILAALIFRMGIAEHRAEERASQPAVALQAGGGPVLSTACSRPLGKRRGQGNTSPLEGSAHPFIEGGHVSSGTLRGREGEPIRETDAEVPVSCR